MDPVQETISRCRARREAGLAKVEPKLHLDDCLEKLPINSQELPKTHLTARDIELTEKYNVIELLALLREKHVSVEEVTRAFLRRAALAQAAVRALESFQFDVQH